MDPIRLLIVDDSLTIRAMMSSVLEKDAKIKVSGVVSNSEEAENFLETHKIDVITLDIEMPGRSGLDYLPSLNQRHIPVVILSSRAVPGSTVCTSALLAGAAGYFNKAHSMSDAASLIKLIKAAACHKVKLSAEDHAALAKAKEDMKPRVTN